MPQLKATAISMNEAIVEIKKYEQDCKKALYEQDNLVKVQCSS